MSLLKTSPSSSSLLGSSSSLPLTPSTAVAAAAGPSVKRSLTLPSRRRPATKPSPTFRALEPYLESDDETDDEEVIFFTTRSRRSSSASAQSAVVVIVPAPAPAPLPLAAPGCITLKAAPPPRKKASPAPSTASSSLRTLPRLKRALTSPVASTVDARRPRMHSRRTSAAAAATEEDDGAQAAHVAALVSNGMTCTYASSAAARTPNALSRAHSKGCLRFPPLSSSSSSANSSGVAGGRSHELLRALATLAASPAPVPTAAAVEDRPTASRTGSSGAWWTWAGYAMDDEPEDTVWDLLSFGARA